MCMVAVCNVQRQIVRQVLDKPDAVGNDGMPGSFGRQSNSQLRIPIARDENVGEYSGFYSPNCLFTGFSKTVGVDPLTPQIVLGLMQIEADSPNTCRISPHLPSHCSERKEYVQDP